MRFPGLKMISLSMALMVSSLLLLVMLQFFWLRNSYERVYADLRKKTNEVFKGTVQVLRDSALLRNIEHTPADSIGGKNKRTIEFTERIDSSGVHHGKLATSELKVFIASDDNATDSVRALLRPLVSQMHERKFRQGTFTIRLSNDSLSLDTLLTEVQLALADAGIDDDVEVNVNAMTELPVTVPNSNILMRRRMSTDSAASNMIRSEWVPYDPFHRYAVTLTSFRPMLFREIAPQILFSVFVTMLTATAFVIMYRSLRSQQRLMQLKNDFISNITHELKTPVTTVSVALEALRNFKGLENPQTTREYLDIAQSELNRLTLLTDKILKAAIFENKGIGFQPEPVDLLKTVDQILHSMKLIFDKQKAQVNFERKGDSFTIIGGSVHLTNVIYNLLDNALKYSGGEPKISISLLAEENQVILKVADQGIGIPSEYSKKIFEKFFRVPTGDVHNVKGYGLGLSYVQAVIKSHHGLIEVSSKPGEGSIFTVFLPKQTIS